MMNSLTLPQARRSLQTKAIIAVTALVTVPTALCGYLMHARAAQAMERTLMRDSVVLAQTTSHLIEGYFESNRLDNLSGAIQSVMEDPRIAFMVITDDNGRVVEQRYNEPLAWHTYQAQLTPQERTTPLTLNRSIKLTDHNDDAMLVVRRQLIRSEPATATTVQTTSTSAAAAPKNRTARHLSGYLELGLSDPDQRVLLTDLRDATILVVAVISLLCVPLVIWWVRGWITPLRRMLAATLQLGLGERFEHVDIRREDEIGMLARSFNAMAENLSAIQNALINANEQLEHKVAQRTRELEKANTRLEQEMVEKDQFIRAVTHDLGAPLRNIDGLASMLMLKHKAHLEEDVLSKLERISANVKAENELLNDLLELSRIKTRQGRKHDIDLQEVINSIRDSLGFDLESHRIELCVDASMPALHAERNRIRQVFQNLIDNAIKYMPDEATERKISVGAERGHDHEWIFHVRDTGHGIAEKDQQDIFQVFRRARYSGNPHAAGRGVGLATVKTIIEHYGGTIWVTSKPPHGATFFFTLDPQYIHDPLASAEDKASREPAGVTD
ncbi:HAMP domain-containing histidine kinase [Planctomycetales bacterium ZRK34]|nr:HAMP domain-containing histidine kinase [Planctomycetales bacterium ZRK34]